MKSERPSKSQIPTRRQGISSATSKPSPQKISNNDSKNEEGVSRRSEDQHQQIQIKRVIEFIQKTMVTLTDYENKLRGLFSSETIQAGMQ